MQPSMIGSRRSWPLYVCGLRFRGRKHPANRYFANTPPAGHYASVARPMCGFGANEVRCTACQCAGSVSRPSIRFVALCVGLDTDAKTHQPSADGACIGEFPVRCYIFEAQTVADQKHRARQARSDVMSGDSKWLIIKCNARLRAAGTLAASQVNTSANVYRGALINEDASGCCMGSR